MIDIDMDFVQKQLKTAGITVDYKVCDGFTCAPLALEKEWTKAIENTNFSKNGHKVWIVGYSELERGKYDKISHGAEHIERIGYTVEIYSQDSKEYPVLNWVVSAEGLEAALLMQKKADIPFIAGIPVGKHEMLKWRKEINQKLGREKEEIIELEEPVEKQKIQKNFLIIGEPFLNLGIKEFLEKEEGFTKVKTAVYLSDKRLKHLYERCSETINTMQEQLYFSDVYELQEILKDVEIVIADPLYEPIILKDTQITFIKLPYPLLSGNYFSDIDYAYFGKKGAEWLRKNLKIGNKE